MNVVRLMDCIAGTVQLKDVRFLPLSILIKSFTYRKFQIKIRILIYFHDPVGDHGNLL